MKCAQCGATNPERAAWCGQCLSRFDAPVPVPATEVAPAASAGAPQMRAGFISDAEGISWQCITCGEINPLDLNNCTVCGTTMAARFEAPPADPKTSRRRARIAEAAVPGLGHALAGFVALGATRGALALIWLGGAAAFTTAGGRSFLLAVPLLLGSAALWVTGPGDLDAALEHRQPVLDGRRLGWLTLGVTLLLLIGGGVVVITAL